MCGIAGVINVASVDKLHVENMIGAIRYRGADEAGVKTLGNIHLGHARLAVVDPVNGKQPMTNSDGTVWVTFNGEIYNYVELREELKSKGYHFKSRCDTEVLVHLWSEEGEKMLDRLIGMFAFFIWDTRKNRGILARDRQGIKPCYITQYKEGYAYASEMKALLTLPEFPKEINYNSLHTYFAFNYCPLPETCFKGIYHLEPGCYLLFEGQEKPKKVRYWSWPFDDEKKDVSHDEFADLLDDAIRLQMRFDVDGAFFLSGGVDSSVIASHLRKQWKKPTIECFGLDVDEGKFSEFQYSKFVADKYGFQLNKHFIDPLKFPDLSSKVVRHAEQPHGDFSFFLFHELCRAAHEKGNIVVFNGDGPDEPLFGFLKNESFFSTVGRTNFGMKLYFDQIVKMNSQQYSEFLSPDFNKEKTPPFTRFQEIIAPYSHLDPIEQVLAYEVNSLMPSNNLVKSDRMGACWSIEGRSPFLDHRISELFIKLPTREKFFGGIGKKYLKEYALRFYDKDFIFRPKTMPIAPVGEWIRGPLYGWAYEILSQVDDQIVNKKTVLSALESHKNGQRNYYDQLRTIMMMQIWKQEFYDKI